MCDSSDDDDDDDKWGWGKKMEMKYEKIRKWINGKCNERI